MKIIAIVILLALIGILLSIRCMKFKYSRSSKRIPPIDIVLQNDVHISSCGAVYMNCADVDFFTSSFKIRSNDVIIYIDPMLVDTPKKADYIFLTHAHNEHFSTEDIDMIMGENTKIICPEYVAKNLEKYPVIAVTKGLKMDLGKIKIEVLASGEEASDYQNSSVGYIIEVEGSRIYHVGDKNIPSTYKKTLNNITLAMIPIDSDKGTIGLIETTKIINEIMPKVVVPMHYDIRSNSLDLFVKNISSEISVEILHGDNEK